VRELVWMAEGKNRAEWEQTAALLAMLHNVNCAKPGDRRPARDFNPCAGDDEGPRAERVPLRSLKSLFLGGS
jgi:hypothetical protein